MPTPRMALAAAAAMGRLYAAGGIGMTTPPGGFLDSYAFESYDPETDTWTGQPAIPALPTAKSYPGAATR